MKKGINIFISRLLIIIMLASFMPMNFIAFAASEMKLNEGVFSLQAEKATIGAGFKVIADGSMSGGSAVNTQISEVDQPASSVSGDLEFSFKADKAATYYLWSRVRLTKDKKWLWLSLKGSDYSATAMLAKPNELTWIKLGEVEATKAGESILVKIRVRSGYFDLDEFAVAASEDDILKYIAKSEASAPAATNVPSKEPVAVKPPVPMKLKDGMFTMEAEDAAINSGFKTLSDATMSGGSAINTKITGMDQPENNTPGEVEFAFKSEKAVTYHLWAKVRLSKDKKMIWLSMGGSDYKLVTMGANPNVLTWVKIGEVTPAQAGEDVLVKIRSRVGYFDIDQFIATDDFMYLTDVAKLPEGAFPVPSITPIPEHPRVLFRAKDIPVIKANLDSAENAAAYSDYKRLLGIETDGVLPAPKSGATNYNAEILAALEAKALEYALNKNESLGKATVKAMKNYLKTCVYDGSSIVSRPRGHVVFTASEIYDWCYPLLSDEDKKEIVFLCQGILKGVEVGFPPKGLGAITSHAGEAMLLRDWIGFSIATYDEYPDIYNYVAGRFFAQFVEPRNYWFLSQTHHQGASGYGVYRFIWDLWSNNLMTNMSGDQQIYSSDMGKVMYEWLYMRRPDGQFFRSGESVGDAGGAEGEEGFYWNRTNTPLFFASNFYKDPYLKKELLRVNPGLKNFVYTDGGMTPAWVLILNDPSILPKDVSNLPMTKYFGSPNGAMVARTGWNDGIKAPDVVAYMRIGELNALNHQQLDAGHFQIYYKGILASDSGFYETGTHTLNYEKRSVAHNTLSVFDPNEIFPDDAVNDGGQRFPSNRKEPTTMEIWMKDGEYITGKVLAHEFGPDSNAPEYSYISGDITKAYSAKVEEVRRSMIFLPTGDASYPAAFVVMDKITAANPTFKKSFLLHTQQEPEISGNVTVVNRNEYGYDGRLTNQTLLPKEVNIEKIGGEGKNFWVNGANYGLKSEQNPALSAEVGWGRVEISPTAQSKTDYFLNVMYVSDASGDATLQKADLIETEQVVGTKLFDRIAVFGKDANRLEDAVSFAVPGENQSLKVNVAGLKAGTWKVTVNGQEAGEYIASEDGGIIYFMASAGQYQLQYLNANSNKSFSNVPLPEISRIDIKVNDNYIYSDVAPVIINDRTLVPMRAIFERLKANVSWDDDTKTATAVKGDTEIKITEDSKIAYINGAPYELDVAATVINGRFVVPVRFVSEALGAGVVWDDSAQSVLITSKEKLMLANKISDAKSKPKEGAARIIGCKWSNQYQDQSGNLSYDGDPITLWSLSTEGWVAYELEKTEAVKGVYIMLNKPTERVAYFDIEYSEDGENYQKIKSFTSDGKSDGELFVFDAPVTAKYFRFYGKGNSVNKFNGVREMEFRL